MPKLYLVNQKTGEIDPTHTYEGSGELDQYKQFAQQHGLSLFDDNTLPKEYRQEIADRLRSEGKALGELTNAYIKDPKANEQAMIDAGYDPRTTTEKVSEPFRWFAPATETAVSKGMGPVGTLVGAGIDLGSMLLGGGAGGAASRALGAKGAGALGRFAGGSAADVATGAIASGAQQGYGKGGFDVNAAKMGGAVGGGAGSIGGAIKELGPRGFRSLSGELSGVAPEALEKYARGGAGREAILNAKPASEIGEKLMSDLNNMEELIPESKTVAKILEGKEVPKQVAIDALEKQMYKLVGTKGFVTPEETPAFEKLQQWVKTLEQSPDMIPANEMRKIRSQIDGLAKYGSPEIGQGSSALVKNSFKEVATPIRKVLEDVGGPEYASEMASWKKKIEAKNDVLDFLGTNPRTREKAVESKIDNLYGRNKNDQRKIFTKFDDIFGKGYSADIENSAYAKKLGIDLGPLTPISERSPAWASQHTTGKSGLGLAIAGGVGGVGGMGISPVLSPIAPAAIAAWSPKASTSLLSEMYNPSIATKTVQATVKQGKNVARNVNSDKKKDNDLSKYK